MTPHMNLNTNAMSLDDVVQEAKTQLDASAAKLRARLEAGDTHDMAWKKHGGDDDGSTLHMRAPYKHGHIKVWCRPNNGYPGIAYSSSQGTNSENSFSGFLPGVTLDEALLLVRGAIDNRVRVFKW
jgi:hypothetical protein